MTDIASHVRALDDTKGTDDFKAAYAAVAKLSREDVNAIASDFVAPTAKNATKASSLDRIQKRHDDIASTASKTSYFGWLNGTK